MRPKWLKLASLAHSKLSDLWYILNLFNNKFDFTTAGDRDCVTAVERLPVLHYSTSVKLAVAVKQYTAEVSSAPVAVATATDVLQTSYTSL